jgi:hypothetical protein
MERSLGGWKGGKGIAASGTRDCCVAAIIAAQHELIKHIAFDGIDSSKLSP